MAFLIYLVKPLSVKMSITDDYLLAGRRTQLECLSFGSRPPAQLTWWKEGKKINTSVESVDDNGNWTLSKLLYIPISQDDHKQIVCQAENVNLKGLQIRDTLSFDIFCKHILFCLPFFSYWCPSLIQLRNTAFCVIIAQILYIL